MTPTLRRRSLLRTGACTLAASALATCVVAGPAAAQGVTWDTPSAHTAVKLAFAQVLERNVDPIGLRDFTALLVGKNISAQELVYRVANSREYRRRFIDPYVATQNWQTVVTKAYQHLLNRAPESTSVVARDATILRQARYSEWLKSIVFSSEYTAKWGATGIPGHGAVATHAS